VTGTTTLYANPYTWNNISNVLFLEAPAGVGFSYCDTPGGLIANDTTNAADNLAAVTAFFAGFPEYSSNEFFITGESYAGIYVPTTAYAIVEANKVSPNPINLKGIMVGNGCLGTEVGICGDDGLAAWYDLEEWRGHGLVSLATYNAAVAACGNFATLPPACNKALNAAAAEVGHINMYYIYGPCHTNFSAPAELAPVATPAQLRAASAHIAAGGVLDRPLAHSHRIPPSASRAAAAALGGPDACIDAGDITAYLNQPSVISALHVVTGLPWVICSGNISYTPTEPDERRVIYPTLLQQAQLRVLIFNGEADACVPWVDNEAWTISMNYTVTKPWKAWMWDPDNVGGYITQYTVNGGANSTFAFTTVRGAGHMVPEFEPQAAWSMANRFLNQLPW